MYRRYKLLAGMSLFFLAAAPARPREAAQPYDLVVVGGTPGGIACAVRAARQGLQVLLVNESQHLGGMLTGGMTMMDTQYEGSRAPILEEFCRRVLDYYRTRYGENSPEYHLARPPDRTTSAERMTFEPHAAEKVFDDLIKAEKTLTVWRGYHPVAVERAERLVQAVLLMSFTGKQKRRAEGRIFADATYEGDLMAVTGAQYRVGRESREEYGEPHAGRIFTKLLLHPDRRPAFPQEALTGGLNLRPFYAVTQQIYAGSTGEGDHKIQAYHYRLVLSRDPNNRRYPDKPARYERSLFAEQYAHNLRRIPLKLIPNNKAYWFQNFSGSSDKYPTADWSKRREIMASHRDFALGMLYFLQNDRTIPDDERRKAREWGLAKDEFTDNDNFPYQLYVREARRLVGRYVFTEHDASLARGHARTPLQDDSIAVAEWFMDSHEVSTERQTGSDFEGKIILSEITRPSQIPYRTLLPRDIDNLLVPVCLSSSHVGWGTIRLEPTWMHVGEAAGFAAALAIEQNTTPGRLPHARLQRKLVENRLMISFFNDLDMRMEASWVPAVQYLGARGFFDTYNATPDKPLTLVVAREWARTFGEIASGRPAANERARSLHEGAAGPRDPVTVARFAAMLSNALAYWNIGEERKVDVALVRLGFDHNATIRRGQACRLLYDLLEGLEVKP